MSKDALIEKLKIVLADSYTLYLKTQNYHWNVTGPHFPHYHALFEAQYTEIAAAVDDIAERIRTLGAKAPGSYSAFSQLTTIKEDNDDNLSAQQMVANLAADQDALVSTLTAALDVADDLDDEGTEDLLVGRIRTHEKNGWMLRSTQEGA